ncbi:nucleotidyltransferase family protein [Flavitalea flava]
MMSIKEAIILAGGSGTRLRGAVPDLPKCMAPVAGKPFLSYLIDYFREEGIQRFIFALGYKSEVIETYLKDNLPSASYRISLEQEPLGTGGAIQLACTLVSDKTVLVLNGDSFFRIKTSELAHFHEEKQADCTLCLKPFENFDRYGSLTLNPDQSIRHFREKEFTPSGLINGGVYALDVPRFLEWKGPERFSFEKDYLEKHNLQEENPEKDYPETKLFGFVQDEYFIDIGTPEDYERAQQEFSIRH